MLIIRLNIQHGGGKRVATLSEWVLAQRPDVAVLTE